MRMRNYGVYRCRWYIRKYEYGNKYPSMECRVWSEMRKNNQDGTLGKMFPVIPSKVHKILQNNQTYVWYQDDISLAKHRLVGPLQFGTTGRKKLEYPNLID